MTNEFSSVNELALGDGARIELYLRPSDPRGILTIETLTGGFSSRVHLAREEIIRVADMLRDHATRIEEQATAEA